MLSANWLTKVITVPQSDLTLISGTRYQLLVSDYAQLMRELNGSSEGIVYTVNTPLYNNTLATSGTPQILDVINGYTVEFENGNYSVDFKDGNVNFRDVEIKNNVSVGVNNVAGQIVSGSGVLPTDVNDIANKTRDVILSTITQGNEPDGTIKSHTPSAT